MKKVVIVSGPDEVGKKKFVDCVGKNIPILQVLAIDMVDEAAKLLGWEGGKSEKDIKFLSDLKILADAYSDQTYAYMTYMHNVVFATQSAEILFLFIDEPKDVERAKKEFNAITVLITSFNIAKVISNNEDTGTFYMKHDYVIDNDGTPEELEIMACTFLSRIAADHQHEEKLELKKQTVHCGVCAFSKNPSEEEPCNTCAAYKNFKKMEEIKNEQ